MRQANLSLMIMLLLCCFGVTVMSGSSGRLLWEKARSSNWWEQVVLIHIHCCRLAGKFPYVKSTFDYLCEKLSSSVAKSDTVMRIESHPKLRSE